MTYTQDISRDNPGAIIFLIDQSMSMNKPFTFTSAGKPVRRAVYVANAVNKTLEELVSRCLREDGVRDYFEIGVIGYGKKGNPTFCWEDGLAGRRMVPISEVAANARSEEKEVETVIRGETVKETVTQSKWIRPAAYESTPMKAAFLMTHKALEEWVSRHPNSIPPIVINVTDGMANDVDSDNELLQAARRVTGLKTSDGNVLLFNCHIDADGKHPIVFPRSLAQLPDDPYARLLFEMSSEMSDRQRNVICELFDLDPYKTPTMRAMAYNADAVALVKLLDIGTRQAFFPSTDTLARAADVAPGQALTPAKDDEWAQ
ncbi:MAG: VWA domain-containing protein [Alphaproteobacteria bacterium]|nr:VWA domain-containing protein [Alphaproteobacteria bacterium]